MTYLKLQEKMTKNSTCKYCHKKFAKRQHNQKFCSNECCDKYYKENKGKYYDPFLKKRFQVLSRDNFTCQYCGRNPKEDHVKLVIDHIQPRAKNGKDNLSNLITACEQCNLGKGDVLLRKWNFRKNHQRQLL